MNSDAISVTLHAPGLLLRPWEDGDLGAVVAAYSDPAHVRWLDSQIADEADGRKWLADQHAGRVSGKLLSFAVIGTGEGQLAGCMVLKRPDPAGTVGEIGYWTVAAARGRGVAAAAVEAVAQWAYGTLGLARLDILHTVGNEASCRVAEKAGFAFAEILPATPPWPHDGHRHIRHAPSR
ncbi:GNAT family N-acetyltransferase [Streptomyces sp. NPDC050738]|uniref:GNAT family N-acetyltransferase n=1 Tax=Streptomyces sp. NPDC050738 TaxID=3154744 RepID=UPI00343124DE